MTTILPMPLLVLLLSSILPFLPEYYTGSVDQRATLWTNLGLHAAVSTILYTMSAQVLVRKGYPEEVATAASCLCCILFSSHVSRVSTLTSGSVEPMFNHFVTVLGLYLYMKLLVIPPKSVLDKLPMQIAVYTIFALQGRLFFISIVILVDHYFYNVISRKGALSATVWITTTLSGITLSWTSRDAFSIPLWEFICIWWNLMQLQLRTLFFYGYRTPPSLLPSLSCPLTSPSPSITTPAPSLSLFSFFHDQSKSCNYFLFGLCFLCLYICFDLAKKHLCSLNK